MKNRKVLIGSAGGVAALLALSAHAWQVQPVMGPKLAEPVKVDAQALSSSRDAQVGLPAPLPTDASQRSRPAAISSGTPAGKAQASGEAERSVRPAKASGSGVYGRNGEPLNDWVRLSDGRALDPKTGRYYQTMPYGNGRKVVDGK